MSLYKEYYDKYKENGFIVLAFPSNSFGGEPGDNKVIFSYYKDNYDIDFPIFSPVKVNGVGIHPLFKFL